MLFALVPKFFVTAFHLCLGQAEAPVAQFLLDCSKVKKHMYFGKCLFRAEHIPHIKWRKIYFFLTSEDIVYLDAWSFPSHSFFFFFFMMYPVIEDPCMNPLFFSLPLSHFIGLMHRTSAACLFIASLLQCNVKLLCDVLSNCLHENQGR